MVSNKKLQRYEKSILGRLDYALETLREEGDFRNLRNELGEDLTQHNLLNGYIENSVLYKRVKEMDSSNILVERFVNDVKERIKDAYETYKYEHRIEIFKPEIPFKLEDLVLDTLYSTYGSRKINNNMEVQKKLQDRKIYTSEKWNEVFFGSIANHFGSFYGVGLPKIKEFIRKQFPNKSKECLDFDLGFYSTLSVDNLKGLTIFSPNDVNVNTYIDPSKNQITPEFERESYRLIGCSKKEIDYLMK